MLPPRGEGREDSKGSTVGGLQEGKRRRFKKGLGGDEGDSEGTAVTERERERGNVGPKRGPSNGPKSFRIRLSFPLSDFLRTRELNNSAFVADMRSWWRVAVQAAAVVGGRRPLALPPLMGPPRRHKLLGFWDWTGPQWDLSHYGPISRRLGSSWIHKGQSVKSQVNYFTKKQKKEITRMKLYSEDAKFNSSTKNIHLK